MRLPGTKIYRAFPELDRFSDEQCQRFLRSALRPMHRYLRWTFCIAVGGGIFFALTRLSGWAGGLIPFRPYEEDSLAFWMMLIPIMVVPVSGCVIAAVLLRDFLLRQRLRDVINTRGACDKCGYGLLGLPVSETNTVACPECGGTCEVDPAMGELALGPEGQRSVKAGSVQRGIRLLGPVAEARLYRIIKGLLVTIGTVTLVVGSVVLWRVVVSGQDARRAVVLMANNTSAILDYKVGVLPSNSSRASGIRMAWLQSTGRTALKVLQGLTDENAAAIKVQHPNERLLIDMVILTEVPAARSSSAALEIERETVRRFDKALAIEAVRRMQSAGIGSAVDDAVATPWLVLPELEESSENPRSWNYYEPEGLPMLVSFNAARLAVAAADGDVRGAVRAFETGMKFARAARYGVSHYHFTSAQEAELALLRTVQAIVVNVDDDGLQKMAACVDSGDASPGVLVLLEFDHLLKAYQLCGHFAEEKSIYLGVYGALRYSRPALSFSSWYNAKPYGRLDENLAALDAAAEATKLFAGKRPFDRHAPGGNRLPPTTLFLTEYFWSPSALLPVLDAEDEVNLMRDGLRVVIALELFRREHGQYPERLEELAPRYIARLPLDPWSTNPLMYRRVAAPASGAPGFMLYSVGANGVDDGGADNGRGAIAGNPYLMPPVIPAGDYAIGARLMPSGAGVKAGAAVGTGAGVGADK